MALTRIDHVQLAMPPGGEDVARGFYRDLLGLSEEAKPTELAARGGCGFRSGAVRVHLGVEAAFRPARKAHPALRVAGFEALVATLREAGCAMRALRCVRTAISKVRRGSMSMTRSATGWN